MATCTPRSLVLDLADEEGIRLLQQNLRPNTTRLLAHYVTQQNPTLCGAASAVMILNSSGIEAPYDPWRYAYFTQDNFFSEAVEAVIPRHKVSQRGMTLQELADAIALWGLPTKPVRATTLDVHSFRRTLVRALERDFFVIADFSREALAQRGGGHHSPIAAYDQASDQFLILDVARYKHIPFWVKAPLLWQAVNTLDECNEPRGVVLVCPQPDGAG